MRFGILGPLQVDGGPPAALRGLRLRGLLVLLLLDAGRVVPSERLIDGLYGADPPHNAANALQSQVSRLRQALPADPHYLVEHHPGGYRLSVDPDEVDLHRFTRLAEAGRAALRGGDPARAAEVLRRALELWRGPALADAADLPFAVAHLVRLEELRLGAVEDHARAVLDAGLDTELLPELRRTVAAHPLREPARGLLMRALHVHGRDAEALAQFEEIRNLLAEELGASPSAELAEAHLAVLRGDEHTGPASPSPASARPRGVPHQLTSYVGREEEMRRAEKQLAFRRLVTLAGPGGAGKTRMAVELAGRQDVEAVLVDLAGVRDAADVPQALLGALDLRETGLTLSTGSASEVDRLVVALARREILLVLDNCEHVVDAAAELSNRLLSTTAGLRILATSREPLRVTGEVLIRLSGLPVPDEPDAESASLDWGPEAPAAVRLFADRAADAVPDFALDEDTTRTVLRICRRLDGLPLGIELAAARLPTQSLEEIANRLDDRFRLLSRGSRTALPRHRTLRAVVEWSWDLLGEPERRLARRLTVFAGGCDLAAVAAVCDVPESQALDLLDDLTEKSLVEVADGRYRMLETIRAFCAERAVEAGEDTSLRRAHIAYYLALAEVTEAHLRGRGQLEWLRVLDTERENLTVALHTAIADEDLRTALRLFAALSFYWWMRGMRREATGFAARIMAGLPDGADGGLRTEYLMCALTASLTGADSAQVARLRDSVVERYRAVADGTEPVDRPFLLYLCAVAMGPEVARKSLVLERHHDIAAAFTRDPWLDAMWRIGTGYVPLLDGDLEQARSNFGDACRRFRAIGDRWGLMVALNGLTDTAQRGGDTSSALASMEEALTLAEELGSLIDSADLMHMRGQILLRAGDIAEGEATLHRAVETAERGGAPEYSAATRVSLAGIALERGQLDTARRLAEQAQAECPVGWYLAEDVHHSIDLLLADIARRESG